MGRSVLNTYMFYLVSLTALVFVGLVMVIVVMQNYVKRSEAKDRVNPVNVNFSGQDTLMK